MELSITPNIVLFHKLPLQGAVYTNAVPVPVIAGEGVCVAVGCAVAWTEVEALKLHPASGANIKNSAIAAINEIIVFRLRSELHSAERNTLLPNRFIQFQPISSHNFLDIFQRIPML